MLSIILRPFMKYVPWLVGLILLVLGTFTWYQVKISEAKSQATIEYNNKQLQEVINEKNALDVQNKILQDSIDKQKAMVDEQNKTIQDLTDSVNSMIDNSGDKNIDPLFNEILKKLKGTK